MHSLALKITINLICWGWISFPLTVKGSNVTETLVRHKRDDIPGYLAITYEDNSVIKTVFLLRIINTLATSKTPVYTTKYDPVHIYPNQVHCSRFPMKYYLLPYEVEKVGEVIFYHGVESYSALTLFDYGRTLHGILDEKFYINGLPLSQIGNMNIVKRYMHLISNNIVPRMKKMTETVTNNLNSKSSSSSEGSSDTICEIDPIINPINVLYPEILVGIETLSPTALRKTEWTKLYKYVLAYWNAVDMLFKNLKTINIRINIAGIVMGTDSLSFPFIHENRGFVMKDGYNTILSKKALNGLGKHFYQFLDILDRDSFDFLVFMTRARLIDPNQDHPDAAVVRSPADCGGMRERELHQKSITNRAIIVHDEKYGEFQTAARALTLLMVKPDNGGKIAHREECCQVENSILNKCCEIQLRIYARSKSSCCLLNYPRSLPLPEPRIVITKAQQCLCYGMLPGDEGYIDPYDSMILMLDSSCAIPVVCKDENERHVEVTSKPLDGTPCEQNKFCHANKCI